MHHSPIRPNAYTAQGASTIPCTTQPNSARTRMHSRKTSTYGITPMDPLALHSTGVAGKAKAVDEADSTARRNRSPCDTAKTGDLVTTTHADKTEGHRPTTRPDHCPMHLTTVEARTTTQHDIARHEASNLPCPVSIASSNPKPLPSLGAHSKQGPARMQQLAQHHPLLHDLR